GEGELEEVPSWWYPAVTAQSVGMDHAHPAGNLDPEVMPTVVLDPGGLPEDGDHAGRAGDGRRAAARPAGQGGALWTRAGPAAASGARPAGALGGFWGRRPPTGAPAARGARAAPPPRARGPLAPPPRFGPLPGGHGLEERRPAGSARRLRLLVP